MRPRGAASGRALRCGRDSPARLRPGARDASTAGGGASVRLRASGGPRRVTDRRRAELRRCNKGGLPDGRAIRVRRLPGPGDRERRHALKMVVTAGMTQVNATVCRAAVRLLDGPNVEARSGRVLQDAPQTP